MWDPIDWFFWMTVGGGIPFMVLRFFWFLLGLFTGYPHHLEHHWAMIGWGMNPLGKKMIYTDGSFGPDPCPILNIVRIPILIAVGIPQFLMFFAFTIVSHIFSAFGFTMHTHWESIWNVHELKHPIEIVPMDWTEEPDPSKGKVPACASSGTYNGYPMSNMYRNDGKYWCTSDGGSDKWLTFDCHQYQMTCVYIAYHPSYFAKKVEVYTADERGTPWSQWRKICTKENCSVSVQVRITENHSKYIALRFFNWTNGYVGITRAHFAFLDGGRSANPLPERRDDNDDRSYMIKAVGSSGQYSGYPLVNIYKKNGSYWCTQDNVGDPWITFDCGTHRVSALSIVYRPEYYAKEVTAYTKGTRGGAWNTWTVLKEKKECGPFVDIPVDGEHSRFICLRFKRWTNGYVGICQIRFEHDGDDGGVGRHDMESQIAVMAMPLDESKGRVPAVACSGSYKGYPLSYMFDDNGRYWCSTTNCRDIWITFDCAGTQMADIRIGFHPSYYAKTVEVYTANQRGTPWNQWTKIESQGNCGVVVDVRIRQNHSRFLSLRFYKWTNGFVGITRIHFGFLNGARVAMSDDHKDESHLITAAESSGQYKGYPLQNIFRNDGSYWCTQDHVRDPWITFASNGHRVSRISIVFHPSYFAKQLTVYTKDSSGGGWDSWRTVTEKNGCGSFVDVDVRGDHEQFICLRFKKWTNGYVGICQIHFDLVSNVSGFEEIMPSAPPPEYDQLQMADSRMKEPGMDELPGYQPAAYTLGSDAPIERVETFGNEGGGGGDTGGHYHLIDMGPAAPPQSEVAAWLTAMGPTYCTEYLHLFEKQGFDSLDVISTLTEEDLRLEIGVSKLGHRRKMLMEIEKITL